MPSSTTEQLASLREQLIIYRICYYVFNKPLVSDYEYDMKERELAKLCEKYPDIANDTPYFAICPTVCLGSDSADSYPPELIRKAELALE